MRGRPVTPRYAVGLYRVSTTEQGQGGLGLEAQQASVRAFAGAVVGAEQAKLLAAMQTVAASSSRRRRTRKPCLVVVNHERERPTRFDDARQLTALLARASSATAPGVCFLCKRQSSLRCCILLRPRRSVRRVKRKWGNKMAYVCSRCTIAASSAHAGSARIRTTAPATPCSPRYQRPQRAAEHVRLRRLSSGSAGRAALVDGDHNRPGRHGLGESVRVGAEPVWALPGRWEMDRSRLDRQHLPRAAGRGMGSCGAVLWRRLGVDDGGDDAPVHHAAAAPVRPANRRTG